MGHGTVQWCACLELCHIKNVASDPLKHICIGCTNGLHPICGYKNNDNERLCYTCVYQDPDFVTTNNFKAINETLIWWRKIVDYFESKPTSNDPSTQGSVEVEAMNEDNESKISESLEEFSIDSQDIEINDGDNDEVLVIDNPQWSKRSNL